MTDMELRERAIRVLEGNYKNSVLRHNRELVTVNEILNLLKVQEPVKPILARGWYWCGGIGCRNSLTSALENDIPARKPNYCERCGRKVKWE